MYCWHELHGDKQQVLTDMDEKLGGNTAGHRRVRQEIRSTLRLCQQRPLTSMREPWYGGVAQNFRSSLKLYLPSLQAGKPLSHGRQASLTWHRGLAVQLLPAACAARQLQSKADPTVGDLSA